MKTAFIKSLRLAISLAAMLASAAAFAHDPFGDDDQFEPEYTCGNDGQNYPYGCDLDEVMVGDPVNPYRGNLFRTVKDIETFGNAPIPFVRFYNSRTTSFNAPYWDFGAQQTWQHNWNYEMRQLTTKTHGFFDIKIRFPNGQEYNFTAADSSGEQLVPAADSGDRLYRWPGNTVGYTLITPSGWEYHFQRVNSPKFRLLEVRNGTGLSWTVSYDADGRIVRIANQFGRYLDITRETVDGVTRIASVQTNDGRTVQYNYSVWSPTGTPVLTGVTYPDGTTSAAYTWVGSDSVNTGRPLLAYAHDPMLRDGQALMSWTYNYNAIFDVEGSESGATYLVTGTVLKEIHPQTGDVVLSLPGGGGPDALIYEGDENLGESNIRRKFSNGLITAKKDAEGRKTIFGRDNDGLGCVSSRTDPNGGVTTYIRDNVGRPTAVTDPLGNTDEYVYNSDGFLIQWTDKRGNVTRFIRDSGNRIIRQENPDGSFELATYNNYGQRLTATNRLGGVTSYVYYGQNEAGGMPGDLKTVTDPLGNVTTYTHDAAGRLTSVTDPLNRTTAYAYNWRGNVLSVTHADNSVKSWTYDIYGNPLTETDEAGRTWTRTYNAFQRLATVTDPLGNTTAYHYGRTPNESSGMMRDTVAQVTMPTGRQFARTYDATGLVLTETAGYGTAEASTIQYGYTAAGDLSTVTDGAGGVTAYTTDMLHRVSSVTDPTGRVTSFAYDAMGNRTGVTRPDNLTETVVYDAMGRPTSKTDAMNGITAMTYNAAGKLASVTDPRGQTHAFAYDLKGRKTVMAYPDNTVENWTYDAAGNVISRTSRSGAVLSFVYDTRNRETLRLWNDNSTDAVATTYDLSGRLLSVSTGTWSGGALSNIRIVDTYGYDLAGRPIAETQNLSGLAPDVASQTVSRTLDADGRTIGLTNADASTASLTWNARGLLASVSSGIGNASYTYDGAGRRLTRTLGNGLTTENTYDLAGRPTRLLTYGNSTLADFAQTYNALGSVATLAESQFGLPQRARTLSHDALGQLTQDQDALASPLAAGTYQWTYDAAGNRVSTIHPEDGTLLWAADVANRYVAIGNDAPLHDADGNLAAHGDWSFEHDANGRLVGAASDDARMEIFRDGRGRPVLRKTYEWTRPAVVISQIYAAGGNTGAAYDSDFIELHNRSDAAVSLTGWSVQYAAAASANWSAVPLSGTIPAGGYHLIALHSGANGDPLPAADNSGTLNLAMAGGKAALVNLTTALSGECPDDASIVDFVGYGNSATCHWGNGNAPTLNNAPQKSLSRLDSGCRSLRDNASDFEKGSVSPRNSVTTAQTCDRWLLTESTALFYDGWELNAEANAQTRDVTAVYLHGANTDEIIARADVSNANAPNAVVYYTYDHLGSVRVLSNASGNIVESYQYEAFGKPTIFDASGNVIARSAFGNRFMFTGREYLGTIQLYDYRNRTYSPKWGRFIEVDPIRFEGRDLNLYRYVRNKVFIYIDSDGLSERDVMRMREIFDQYIQEATADGRRISPGALNNFLSSIGFNYLGCGEQAYQLNELYWEERLSQQFDDTWQIDIDEITFFDIVTLHQRLKAVSDNPDDPILIIDPHRNSFEIIWP